MVKLNLEAAGAVGFNVPKGELGSDAIARRIHELLHVQTSIQSMRAGVNGVAVARESFKHVRGLALCLRKGPRAHTTNERDVCAQVRGPRKHCMEKFRQESARCIAHCQCGMQRNAHSGPLR